MVCCMAFALAAPTSAQWRRYSRPDIDRLVRQAEVQSNRFVRVVEQTRDGGFFERIFDRDRNDRAEERVIEQARVLENQLDLIRQETDRTENYFAVRSQVANTLMTARRINNIMGRRQLDNRAERQWTMLRADLNRLARAFGLAQLG